MRLVLEAHHCCNLLYAFATVAQHNLRRADNFIADKQVCSLARKSFANTGEILGRDTEQTCILAHIEIGLGWVVQMLHKLAQDILGRAIGLV